jgi:hypothetical protein
LAGQGWAWEVPEAGGAWRGMAEGGVVAGVGEERSVAEP